MIDIVWTSFLILEIDDIRFSGGSSGGGGVGVGGDNASHDRSAKRLRVASEGDQANGDKGSTIQY